MIKYIVGNSKDILNLKRKHKIPKPNLIITSPPYFDILNYENNIEQIGHGQKKYKDYLSDIVDIFQKCYDLAEENASFWLIIDTIKKDGRVIPIPFDVNNELQNRNPNNTWILREIIIWDKDKNLPWGGKGKFRNQFEYILYFTKGKSYTFKIDSIRALFDIKKWWVTYPERYSPNGIAPSNLWTFTTPMRGWGYNNQNHLCPFPYPLIERIISVSSEENDVVFDPFAGSGSVLAIASLMNRNAFGIDINQKYKDLFETEILISANAMWTKRQKEFKRSNQVMLDYKTTNLSLRKQKCVSKITSYLFNHSVDNDLFVVAIFKTDLDTVLIYAVTDSPVSFTIDDTGIKNLLKQADVKTEIKTITIDKAEALFKGTKLYKYNKTKFYKYLSETSIQSVLSDMDNNEQYFYSNICLSITDISI